MQYVSVLGRKFHKIHDIIRKVCCANQQNLEKNQSADYKRHITEYSRSSQCNLEISPEINEDVQKASTETI